MRKYITSDQTMRHHGHPLASASSPVVVELAFDSRTVDAMIHSGRVIAADAHNPVLP